MPLKDINWDDEVIDDYVPMVFASNFELTARIRARDLVSEEYNRQVVDVATTDLITLEDVFVVSFTGNEARWAALLQIDVENGERYFEVSYSLHNERTIITTFNKAQSTVVPNDKEDL